VRMMAGVFSLHQVVDTAIDPVKNCVAAQRIIDVVVDRNGPNHFASGGRHLDRMQMPPYAIFSASVPWASTKTFGRFIDQGPA